MVCPLTWFSTIGFQRIGPKSVNFRHKSYRSSLLQSQQCALSEWIWLGLLPMLLLHCTSHQACFVLRTRWKLIYSHFSRIMSTHQTGPGLAPYGGAGLSLCIKLMHTTDYFLWFDLVKCSDDAVSDLRYILDKKVHFSYKMFFLIQI